MRLFCVFLLFTRIHSQHVNVEETPANVTGSPCLDRNHIFLAPGVLTAGGTNRACVSRFHPDGPARMVITLLSEDRQTVTASRELRPGDGGCVDISVPQLPNTKAELIVNIRYPEAQCTWERRLSLRISSGRLIVIHTERSRYRPGDTLRARMIALKADLSPAHGVIDEVWIEGAQGAWNGARTAQWMRVRSQFGIAEIQHELDELAPSGKWTVRAKLRDGSQGSADFWVGNYELPPFQLSVRHAPRVLRTSERLVWTVCVRYPWTEAVEGMLVIRLRGAGGNSLPGEDVLPGVRTAVRLRAPRACHRHAAASRRIGLNGANPPDVVVADFSFQEEGTRIWQNTTVVSQVVDKAIALEFLTKHRAVIAPGLPYKLKIKAIRWDDKPASNERVRVCRTPSNHASDVGEMFASNASSTSSASNASNASNAMCRDSVTDLRGIARVLFTADDGNSSFYKFQATLTNDTTVTATPLYLPIQRTGSSHVALGPLRGDSPFSRTFVPLYLNLKNIDTAITVHFVVITRGGIIYRWGATTQCPIANSANQVQIALRNSICNEAIVARLDSNTQKFDANSQKFDTNASDALLDRHLLRVMLPIKVSHQMCPDSHLIAYFYYNGEFISASKQFEMEECFVNKVEATWLSRQTPPGSIATLNLATTGPALCALTVLDTAAKWIKPGVTIKDVLMKGLRRLIDGHRNLTEYETAGECFMNTDNAEVASSSMSLTTAWFAAAGVRLAGGDVTRNILCSSAPSPAPLIADDKIVPRRNFSEAWLWRLVPIGMNGSATINAKTPDSITRFEATALCVAKNGISISPPAVLQVFREFFIHADCPRRLRRGDSTIIRYRIFNYLYEPLSVQIQVLTDPHLEVPTDYVETACVSARVSIARRVEVRARLPGNALLSVRAKSVSDGNCGNGTRSGSRAGVSDEVIIEITVDPEGVPVQEHRSMLLCGKGSLESSASKVNWTWPPVQTVPGTESLTVWAIGDVTGSLLADADALVMLPRGCGEQNMARLATNLLALQHLEPRCASATVAREHVARGLTRQLQYLHPSGGFSAFGASDVTASTWLTAFSIRYLRRAHQVLSPGLPAPPPLERAERWLLNQQMENGCFRNEGQVFHREFKGGLNEEGEIASVALTAYVITSLMESSITLPLRVVRNTLTCLRALPPLKTKTSTRIYAHALLAYTFMRLRKYEEELRKTNEAYLWDRKEKVAGLQQDEEMKELVELLKMAKRNGDAVWWETGSLSTSIEATGYALLALSCCPPSLRDSVCAHDARGAVQWLSTHRSASGGFVSTQDTLVALEALISWSSVQPSIPSNLTVTARSGRHVKSVSLQPGDRVPDIMKMHLAEELIVGVEGTGCALVQATRSYNTITSGADVGGDKEVSAQASVMTEGLFDCDANATNCFCAAVVQACIVWTGSFPEMALLEVSLPGGFGADATLLYAQLQKPNTLLRRIELSQNSGRATLYLGIRDGSDIMGRGGHQCYNIHAVGPGARTKPAYVKVVDYYRPMVNDTQMYTIPEDCPPRISHESNQYLPSDNLFNKAKSLDDNGEIVITDEFSFEDIPEGIPLEDPMYDNLTQIDEENSNLEVRGFDKHNEISKFDIETHSSNLEINNITSITQIKSEESPVTLKSESNNEILRNDIQNQNKFEVREKENQIDNNKITDISHQHTNSNTKIPEVILDSLPVEELKTDFVQNFEEPNDFRGITVSSIDLNKEEIATSKESGKQETVTEELKQVLNTNRDKMKVDNPNLSDFHVIDTEKDLDVPTGIEGPVPAVVLPPQNFVAMFTPEIQSSKPIVPQVTEQNRSFRSSPQYGTYFFDPYNNMFLRNIRVT